MLTKDHELCIFKRKQNTEFSSIYRADIVTAAIKDTMQLSVII